MKRTEGYFRGKNDFELFFQGWVSETARATLVVTHGLGEHSDCYLRLVDGLQKELGPDFLSIYCWDLRGHGRSEGKRGVIKEFQNFSDDLVLFIEFLKKEVQADNILLSSHSMGGLVTLNTLVEYPQLQVLGSVLSSPLLGVAVDVPAFKKTGAKYLAELLPNMTMWNEIPNKHLSHEKKILEEFEKDPLRHDRISPKLYLEMLHYTEKIRKLGHRFLVPMLFQISGKDLVVSSPASQEFFKTLGSKDKTLTIYENSHHEIYNDIERHVCFKEMADWIKTHI